MPLHVIRRITSAHCKKGPDVCKACRAAVAGSIALLELHAPGSGIAQRRAIEISLHGEPAWWEYEIVTTFEDPDTALCYARQHGVEDVRLD